MSKSVWRITRAAVLGILLAFVLMCAVGPAKVTGSSMEPTIDESDLVVINKISYLGRAPGYGDIVVFKSNVFTDSGEGKLLVKRVVAKEGDKIEIKSGKLYVNGIMRMEEYAVPMNSSENMPAIEIAENCVFVLGDNRINSCDSRNVIIGQVDCRDIIGKVDFRLLPLENIGEVK